MSSETNGVGLDSSAETWTCEKVYSREHSYKKSNVYRIRTICPLYTVSLSIVGVKRMSLDQPDALLPILPDIGIQDRSYEHGSYSI